MISVEYAHFLGEQPISSYHEKSYLEFLKIKKAKGIILLDDYNFKVSEDFKIKFKSPVILESEMLSHSKDLLSLLKIKNKNSSLIHFNGVLLKKDNHWTCPALTACWYLVRLGIIKNEKIQPSSKLVNILPSKFKSNEEKVLKILNKIDESLKEKVQYIFIEEDR